MVPRRKEGASDAGVALVRRWSAHTRQQQRQTTQRDIHTKRIIIPYQYTPKSHKLTILQVFVNNHIEEHRIALTASTGRTITEQLYEYNNTLKWLFKKLVSYLLIVALKYAPASPLRHTPCVGISLESQKLTQTAHALLKAEKGSKIGS